MPCAITTSQHYLPTQVKWRTQMYETFSILSGIVLLGAAFVPGISLKDRGATVVGGVALISYAIYVSSQTSDTFYFPAVIFAIPFLGAGYLAWKGLKHFASGGATTDSNSARRNPEGP